ncbi:hypothetical protein NT2_04_03230 [Caenibius tardaugens NBRC 16725]|uniref:DAGKc domain-containing protein n=1 Tax=Caenibius tardaugens NBRC 16725 TaxID=1219035 RepID=U2YK60_9SPHN|nr:diacylglycerol kinase family protein [Caenibius tardaugens]AZI36025.1 diacylglycerol kinase [Caenibius tardaugens NBRC 16725]GAD48910.1 hypothetical protein NT2_04_03230 [Caenibius tardaugens NBRC 16725]
MTSHHTTWLVLNTASGSHDDERQAELLHGLEQAGHAPARIVDCSQDDLPGVEELDGAGVALLVVHGGDGTINSAIDKVQGWRGKVLPLPGGTANLLCRDLFDETEIGDILGHLGGGRLSTVRRTCVRGDGWIALAEVLAGPGAAWADVREDMRDGNIADVVKGTIDAASASTTGPMVVLENPAVGREEGYSGLRMVPEAAGMVVDGYGAAELGDYLKQAVAIIGRDFRNGPHDELGLHPTVVCRMTEEAPIALMVDGERRDGGLREQFSLAELAVDLFCLKDG